MEDIGKIITSIVTILVAVIGLIVKSKEKKTAKAVFESRSVEIDENDTEYFRTAVRARSRELPEEAVRMFAEEEKSEFPEKEAEREKKIRIDKRNLVIYSELMKPKFD